MMEWTDGGYIIHTSSGVMKLGSAPYFGSKVENAKWDEHFKEIDARMKADKTAHGIWSNRPIYEGQYIHRKSGNRKNIIFSVMM